ncbi:MAG: hypothetical protein LBU40_00530, partial [Methanobrevibacter sp.]|nr:hypothetical protein [Methanobrevibacter sp.]
MYTESIKHTLICRNDKAHNGIKLPKIYVQLLTYWCKETYYIYPTEVYKFGTWKNFDIVPDTTNHLYLAQYPDTPQYAKLTRKFVKTSNGGYFNIKPAIHKIGGKFQKRTYTVKLTTIDENLCFLNSQLNHNAFNEKEIENYSLDDHYKLVDKIKSLNLAEITSTPKPDEHNSITYNELDHVPEPVSKSNLDVTQTIPITVKADTINSNIEEFDSFENTMTIEDNLITNSLFSSSNSNTHYINKDFQKLLLEITNAETNNYLPSLEDFLKKRKITIKRVNEERDYGDIRYILSKFLGNNYEQINIFLEKLKSSISRGGRFSMSLRGFSQKQVSNIC